MRCMRWLVPLPLILLPVFAHAQSLAIDLGGAGQAGATGRLVQITALVTVLSLAPSLLVMVTAFTRIVIVLSLLRSALATQGTPPNIVLIGLALFLTFFVMQPVLEASWTTGLLPLTEGRVGELDGLRLATEPFHHFMTANLRPADLQLFFSTSHICRRRRPRMMRPGARWYRLSWWGNCVAPSRWGSCCSCHSW
jgi:flagellar biosynthetic protein FliP